MRRVNLLHAHGSPGNHLYRFHSCRCVVCLAAHAEYSRKYSAEHRDEKAAYRAAHREEIAAYNVAYSAAHREEKATYRATHYAEHREESAAYAAAHYASHREERRASGAAYYASHREEIAARVRARKYNLSPGEWDAMFAAQGNSCAICGTTKPGDKQGWHTDHCHKTGAVRGILCHHCNTSLGGFRDDPERLMAAIEYLEAKP